MSLKLVSVFSVCILRSEIAYHMVIPFFVLEETSILFSIVIASVYIPTNNIILFTSHPGQHLLFLVFFIIAILTCMSWNLIVHLICIPLMISDAEYIFICLLAICISSLEKCLFTSSVHLKIRLFVHY